MKHVCTLLLSILACATSLVAQAPISIADAKRQDLGTTVTKIAGRITSGPQLSNVCYMQDATGGIAVFNENMRTGVRIGDSVVVENGTLTEFGGTTGSPGTGLTQLGGNGLRFTVVPVERVEPSPRNISIPLLGEGVEAQLVRIRRVRFVESGRFQGNTSYNALDNSGNDVVVRIDRSCEIGVNRLEIPTGEVDVIGVISQFRGTYQILPRLATDIGLPPVTVDTVSRDRTLDLSTWNLEWFGTSDTTRGPRNKDLQRTRVRIVLDSTRSDIYALQEIVTEEAVKGLADSMAGSYGYFFASDITSDQKLAYLYNKNVVTPISTGLAVNGGAQAWANGRFPYRMTFDANIGGKTRRFVVFDLHAKATDSATALVDYNRRRTDAETFHMYLRDFYSDSSVIVMGDFNDRLLATNVSDTLPSCYEIFTNDTETWLAATAPLEADGLSSYVGFNRSMLDHILLQKQLFGAHYRTYLEAPERYLSSYSSTVSDHVPVTSRLYVDAATSVNEEHSAPVVARVQPNPMSDHGMVEVFAEQGGQLRVDVVSSNGVARRVVDETVAPSIRLIQLPISELSSGAYRVVVTVNNAVSTYGVSVLR